MEIYLRNRDVMKILGGVYVGSLPRRRLRRAVFDELRSLGLGSEGTL